MTPRPLAIAASVLALVCCKNEAGTGPEAAKPIPVSELVKPAPGPMVPNRTDPATATVQVHCSRCHALPDPKQLTKKLWVNDVLPEMGCYMGMHHSIPQYARFVEKGASTAEAKLFKDRGLYPNEAMIPKESWDLIVTWFLQNSPDELPPSNNTPLPPLADGKFEISFIGPQNPTPRTTLLHIDAARQHFLSSDADDNSLTLHDASGEAIATRRGPSPFTVANTSASSIKRFLSVGTLTPNDSVNGTLWTAGAGDDLSDFTSPPFALLKRPVDAVWHDLDQDGQQEIVVAEYGNKTGQLSLFHKNEKGSWQRTILNDRSGNIRVRVADMNHDEKDDLVVLRAQESEDVLIYYNVGGLKFRESHVLRFPPYWGSSDMELADLNNDGHLDLLLANGDNADKTPVLKNFHGVYVYLNDQRGGFQFNQSFPFHGAYGVRTLDYDLDGDLDFVTFSTFPNFQNDQIPVRLVEQVAPLKFKSFSIPQSRQSRWIVMDVGDLDGDGDCDVLLGPNIPNPSPVPQRVAESAKKLPGPFLFMRNLAAP